MYKLDITNDEALKVVKWAENVAKEHDVNVLSVISHFSWNYEQVKDIDKAKNNVEEQMRRIFYEKVRKES